MNAVQNLSHVLKQELEALLGPEGVLTDPIALRAYDCDAYSPAKHFPDAVALPQTTEQVSAIVKLCNRLGVPFTPRGAGTGLSGGATAVEGGVVIATTRLNKILRIDVPNRRLVAQAGVVNTYLTKAVKAYHLHYAPDPSSQGACTVGGNVAENAGGPHTLKYGVTTNHITGLTLVLPDGEIVALGGFEEETPGYDLVGLVVGAEGTMGIVTEVTVRLTPLPQSVRTLLAIFETIDQATRTVSDIIAAGVLPAALEMIDTFIIKACEEAFHLGFPSDAEAVLIIEVDGLEVGLDEEAEQVRQIAFKNGAREVRQAKTEQERALLWKARKQAFGALGRLGLSMVTHDGVIPRTKLPEVLREVRAIAQKHNLLVGNVFHAGDGNLHPNLMFDERDPQQVARVMQAGEEILKLCVDVGGSLTGEHGIGVEKMEAMTLLFSEADLDLMQKIKSVFNRNALCNPGKVLPTSKRCWETEHGPRLVRSVGRGAAV
ncbi:MAG TPA: FAD-linked oxidase C-terminal domain-containing protein [Chthonomonas sp.]|uniref:FAD-binding oxidoreductase n=1 Tax=Chthonomonas sp. TaxID=2282153 RepID=UPI002B4B4C0D|nr:FAD-linked oxidase C-terminal domain-containing protein [Chthonomonas sp.]HLI49655.1 FAD-linked oxidase C-terminal domain-containing protein [Chthonomonas sp.]